MVIYVCWVVLFVNELFSVRFVCLKDCVVMLGFVLVRLLRTLILAFVNLLTCCHLSWSVVVCVLQ